METKQQIISKCAIVCGARIKNTGWLKDLLISYDFIIAADSGYDHLKKVGIQPHILIGDFDSISSVPENVQTIKYPSKKDATDFSLCLEYCFVNGITKVDVYGAWGNRADHSLAAVFTMQQYCYKGMDIQIIGENTTMFIVNDYCKLPKFDGYISIFALVEAAKGVTLNGFEYPLNDYTLESCSPLGVSNRIIDEYGKISVKDGSLLVVIEKQ